MLQKRIVDGHISEEGPKINEEMLQKKIQKYTDIYLKKLPDDAMQIRPRSITCLPYDVGFDDVIGIEDGKQIIADLLDLLQDETAIQKYHIELPSGILLHGPPGCGKTHFARAIAGTWHVPLIRISPADLMSRWSGETESNIRQLFIYARYLSPCVLFLDELDGLGRSRSNVRTRFEQMDLSQLLIGVEKTHGCRPPVLMLGATNRLDDIDPALRRPGRFTREIYVGPPNQSQREALLRHYTRNRPISPSVDYTELAEQTTNMTGADIKQLCNDAARHAWRRAKREGGNDAIGLEDFTAVLQQNDQQKTCLIYQ